MPLAQKGVATFSDHLPKVITPKAHAVADYIMIGGFALMTALFWKRNRRAAVAALICAGSEAANTLLTDYPGGVTDVVSFQTHGKIDVGIAAGTSALPTFFGFSGTPESKFFQVMGLNITVVGAMTDFSGRRRWKPLRRIA